MPNKLRVLPTPDISLEFSLTIELGFAQGVDLTQGGRTDVQLTTDRINSNGYQLKRLRILHNISEHPTAFESVLKCSGPTVPEHSRILECCGMLSNVLDCFRHFQKVKISALTPSQASGKKGMVKRPQKLLCRTLWAKTYFKMYNDYVRALRKP